MTTGTPMLDALPAAGSLGGPASLPGGASAAAPQAPADAFGPALIMEPAEPPSIFVVYDATGAPAQGTGVANPTITPSVTANFANVPYAVLLDQLGSTIMQIQLHESGGAGGGFYSIGYNILV